MCVVHHKLTLVFRSMTGFERVLVDRKPLRTSRSVHHGVQHPSVYASRVNSFLRVASAHSIHSGGIS